MKYIFENIQQLYNHFVSLSGLKFVIDEEGEKVYLHVKFEVFGGEKEVNFELNKCSFKR